MNKTVTQNKSYMSLLENTLFELFSPSSDKALLDYKQLNLIDKEQMKIIDFNQLKLLDLKEFNLLNLAVLSVFFQYIGAFFLTLSFGFMVAFGAFTLHSTINSAVLAREVPSAPSKQYARSAEVTISSKRVQAERSTSTFAVLIDKGENAQPSAETAVLGVSDEKPSVEVEVTKNACSFRVVEGEHSARYSSGSVYSSAKVFKLCVDSNKESESFGWSIDSESSSNTSNCLSSVELQGAESVSATLVDENGSSFGACDLTLVKNAAIAAIN